eukprot:CAMPEP_0178438588 /NCGR_PEP_ID=MMETSP0689_2-20121128/35672_1 /TAXON_ID=160604 /ORGANISM="Amphidinium massartii, Strain CS-259" /LENGTH=169 /DNA_ID=CAMNT_0020060999 /DNA_START=49 /DNA_END=555 /DNA_ORIENTATION=+
MRLENQATLFAACGLITELCLAVWLAVTALRGPSALFWTIFGFHCAVSLVFVVVACRLSTPLHAKMCCSKQGLLGAACMAILCACAVVGSVFLRNYSEAFSVSLRQGVAPTDVLSAYQQHTAFMLLRGVDSGKLQTSSTKLPSPDEPSQWSLMLNTSMPCHGYYHQKTC